MASYIVSDTDMTSVANAIRTKGGTSASLTFPNGFVSAIQNIPGGGGGGWTVGTKTATASNYPTSLSFTGMSGQPKAFFLRATVAVSSSGNTTYYYIVDMEYDGTSTKGNCFRIGSTRQVNSISSGYSWSYSGTTLTISSSASSRSSSPGAFYSSYELIYFY